MSVGGGEGEWDGVDGGGRINNGRASCGCWVALASGGRRIEVVFLGVTVMLRPYLI